MIRPTPTSTARSSSRSLLLLPWKPIRLGVEARTQRDGQLAAGADVEAEPLLGDPAHAGHGQERLAGVVDVGAVERVLERPGTCAEVVLVDDVGRRTELSGELGGRHPATVEHARVGLGDVRGPQRRDQRVRVGRARSARTGRDGRPRRGGRPPRGRASHPLGRGDAEQVETAGEDDTGRVDEEQPGPVQVGGLLVTVRQHAARRRRTCGTSRPSPPGSAPAGAARAGRPPMLTTRGNSASARSRSPSRSCDSSAGSKSSPRGADPRSAPLRRIEQSRAWAYCT